MLETFYEALVSIGFTDPVHPIFNHLPIGLVIAALVLLPGGMVFRQGISLTAGYMIILALLFALPTIFFGILDWQHYFAGAVIFPIRMKLILAGIFVLLLAAAIVTGYRGLRFVTLFIYVLLVVNVFWLGFYGGRLVFAGRAPVVPEYRQGALIYRGNCVGCHPFGGNILQPQHAMRGSDKLKDKETVTDWIRNPMAPMPPFPPLRIPDVQASKLYDYTNHVFGGHKH